MADKTKTKEQLTAEIEGLKKDLAQPASGTDTPPAAADPAAAAPPSSTRRGALSWIAPVILALGTAAQTTAAQAQTDDLPPPPPPVGRCVPTVAPTLGMAAAPDARPSRAGFVPLGSARAAARAKLAQSA